MGYYPVSPLSDIDPSVTFKTSYEVMMSPVRHRRMDKTPGYSGHLQGKQYIVGQGCPAGVIIPEPKRRDGTDFVEIGVKDEVQAEDPKVKRRENSSKVKKRSRSKFTFPVVVNPESHACNPNYALKT